MNTNNIINSTRQNFLFAEMDIDGSGTSTAKPTAPARLSVDYPILVALVDKIVDRKSHPNHRIKQLREVLAEKFGATEDKSTFDVEKAIREYYESDPVALAEAKAKKEAEAAARKAEREAKQKAREREIAEFFGEI